MLRLKKKNFEDKELPHELFLTRKQITKMRNTFDKNISTNIKLSKDQTSDFLKEV